MLKATNYTPADAYKEAKNEILRTKEYCQRAISKINAGGMNADDIVRSLQAATAHRVKLEGFLTVPNIDQYAKDQEGVLTYDFTGELTAFCAMIETTVDSVKASMPYDAEGYLQCWKFDAARNGLETRHFTTETCAPFLVAFQNIIDLIE
jgi:hypothetical protein